MRRAGVAALAAAVLTVGLAGCGSDPNSVAEQAKAGDNKGYISGDGTVEVIPEASRGEPVSLSGPTVTGSQLDISDYRDKIVVINVWGSWCAPCVAEAPDLQSVWDAQQKAKAPVQFVGIDFREDPARGRAFAEKAGVTYPSLSDPSGSLILNLQNQVVATPTTLVLDRLGRIAARVAGPVTAATLSGLIEDVRAQ